jgi:hypothetical protein
MIYIDSRECIDCDACPVNTIFPEAARVQR